MHPLSFVQQVKKLYPEAKLKTPTKSNMKHCTPGIALPPSAFDEENIEKGRKLIALMVAQTAKLAEELKRTGLPYRISVRYQLRSVEEKVVNYRHKGDWRSLYIKIIRDFIPQFPLLHELCINGATKQGVPLFSTRITINKTLYSYSSKYVEPLNLDTPLPKII